MTAPHDAVRGGDEVNGIRTKPANGREGGSRLPAIRLHDVRVVLARLPHDLVEVILVIKAGRAGEMLAKGIVGEENLVVGVVGDHVVGPVDHGRLHEGERALADAERVTRLDTVVSEVAIVRGEPLHTLRRRAVNLAVGRRGLDGGHVARVVHLDVVGDKDVDLRRVDDRGDAGEQLVLEGDLGGVDERDLLVHDEVRVVGDAVFRGVAMEAAGVPVDAADPVHVGLDLHCRKHETSLRHGACGGPDGCRPRRARWYSATKKISDFEGLRHISSRSAERGRDGRGPMSRLAHIPHKTHYESPVGALDSAQSASYQTARNPPARPT